jgi:hypothetical protein
LAGWVFTIDACVSALANLESMLVDMTEDILAGDAVVGQCLQPPAFRGWVGQRWANSEPQLGRPATRDTSSQVIHVLLYWERL